MATRDVSGVILKLNGAPWLGANVKFRPVDDTYTLSPDESYPITTVTGTTDADGAFTVTLATGLSVEYEVTMPDGETFRIIVSDGAATTLELLRAAYDASTPEPLPSLETVVGDIVENLGIVDTANSPNANEFARFTDANTIEGRTTSETRADLGLVIGTNVQAWSANLDEYSAVNPTAAGLALLDDADTAAQLITLGLDADIATLAVPASTTISAFGATLVDDAAASNARTTLGLGTIATQDANAVSISGGSVTGITDITLADGGTGASLVDPNADRIMFWDDSAGAVAWLTPGTNLSITATTIDAAGGGASVLDDLSDVYVGGVVAGNGLFYSATAGGPGVPGWKAYNPFFGDEENTSDLWSATTGEVPSSDGAGEWIAASVASLMPAASDTVQGKVELATTAETTTGTDATRAVTPDSLHDMTSLAGAAWFLDEDTMSSNLDTKVPSQQSVKAYVDGRFKGNTDANLLFVDAGADSVAIGNNAPTSWLDLKAGTTARAPLRFPSGTNLTTAIAGAVEYDGNTQYWTNDTTSGRAATANFHLFRLNADGAAIGAAIADFFGANSAFPTVAGAIYQFEAELVFLKNTAGTLVWTMTNTQAYTNLTASLLVDAVAGGVAGANSASAVAAPLLGKLTKWTTAAAAFAATASLTTNTQHVHRIMGTCKIGTAGNIRFRVTNSAGTVTPLEGSFFKFTRIPAANVGTFVA